MLLLLIECDHFFGGSQLQICDATHFFIVILLLRPFSYGHLRRPLFHGMATRHSVYCQRCLNCFALFTHTKQQRIAAQIGKTGKTFEMENEKKKNGKLLKTQYLINMCIAMCWCHCHLSATSNRWDAICNLMRYCDNYSTALNYDDYFSENFHVTMSKMSEKKCATSFGEYFSLQLLLVRSVAVKYRYEIAENVRRNNVLVFSGWWTRSLCV